MDHREFSRKGGQSKSERKSAASKANIAKARERRLSKKNETSDEKQKSES